MAFAAAGRPGDEHIEPIGRIGDRRHGDTQLIFQAAVYADQAGKCLILRRVCTAAVRLRLCRHILRFCRCRLRLPGRWKKADIFLALAPQPAIGDQTVELHCGIVAPDTERIRHILRRYAQRRTLSLAGCTDKLQYIVSAQTQVSPSSMYPP